MVLAVAAAAQQAPPGTQAKFRISGTVVDAIRGETLPNIEVSISLSQAESVLQTVITGPDGRFEFGDLVSAKYSLLAHGNGYLPQGYEQHQSFFTGIVAGPGFESEKLVFRLKPDASISGTVTDEFGDPVPLAEVLLFASETEAAQAIVLMAKMTADDAGYYQLVPLREGKYYLAVTARPWYTRDDMEETEQKTSVIPDGEGVALEEPSRSPDATTSVVRHHSELDVAFQTRYYVNATDPELATPIILKPGERATADFHLFAVPAVHLKIHGLPAFMNAARPLVLWERIFSYSRQAASQSIDEDGTELESLSPGRYLLELPPQVSGGLPQQRPLDLVADAEVVPGEGAKSISTVTGTIQTEATELPCQRCNVVFVSPSGERFVTQNTSAGFQIDGGLRAGSYAVWPLNTENYLIKKVSAVGARVVGTQIEIQSGATVRLSIVMTKDAGTIDGIALQHGKPISQAAVFLVPTDPAHNPALYRRDQSDSDGTFALRRVLPGEYTVVAVSEGWDLQWTNPTVLKPYLGGGVKVRVQPGGKYRVEVAVQALEGNPK